MGINAPHLDRLLRAVASRQRTAALSAVSSLSLSGVIVSLAGAAALDAALAPGRAGRVALSFLLLAASAAAVAALIITAHRRRYCAGRIARDLESRAAIGDSLLISALQLGSSSTSPGSRSLAAQACADADAWASAQDPRRFDDPAAHRRARVAMGAAVCLLACISLAAALAPGVPAAVLPRLFAPWADLPPFTRLRFRVIVEPRPLLAHRPASIRVRITGPVAVPSAAVVFPDDPAPAGSSPSLAMSPLDAPGEFTLALDAAGRPRDFFIQTPAGRSARVRLNPLDIPASQSLEATIASPAYARLLLRTQTFAPNASPVLRALDGSTLTVTLVADRPPLGAVLHRPMPRDDATSPGSAPTTSPTRLPMAPDPADPRRMRVSFAVQGSGELAIDLPTASGEFVRVATARVESLRDEFPRVLWREPLAHELAVPVGWPVELAAEAFDDLAVASLELHVEGRPDAARPAPIADITGQGSPEARVRWRIDPAALGLVAGSRVVLRAIARDALPPAGQAALSEPLTLRVVSDAEYQRLAAERFDPREAAAEAERFARAMAAAVARHDRLNALARNLATPPRRAESADLAQSPDASGAAPGPGPAELERHAALMRALASRLAARARPPYLSDDDAKFAAALASAAEALNQASASTDDLADANASSAASADASAATARFAQASQHLASRQEELDRLARAARANASAAAQASGAASAAGPGRAAANTAAATPQPVGLQGPHASTHADDLDPSLAPGHNRSAAADRRVERLSAARSAPATRPAALPPASFTGLPAHLRPLAEAYFDRLNEPLPPR